MKRYLVHFTLGAITALSMIQSAVAETESVLFDEKSFDLPDYYNNFDAEIDENVIPVNCCNEASCGYKSGRKRNCCRPARGWYGGVEATFLAPNFKGTRSTQVDISDFAGPTTNSYLGNNNEDLAAGPRVWLGVQGCKWGGLVRYWGLDSTQVETLPYDGIRSAVASDAFEAYTLDAEITRKFSRRKTKMVGSFGVRHARLNSVSTVTANESIGPDFLLGSASSSREFEGTGLTFGLNGLRRIRCSNWNIYFNSRGSILWGDSTARADTTAVGMFPGGAGNQVNGAVAVGDDSMFIAELQLGLQRYFKLKCLPATAFFRGALEYQVWNADGSALADSTSGVVLPATSSVATATAGDLETDLVGFTLGTGFYW